MSTRCLGLAMADNDSPKAAWRQRKNNLFRRQSPRETPYMNDPVAALEKFYTAVVADVLDSLGHRNQTLSADIRAMTSAHTVCGRVFTAKAQMVSTIPDEPYKLEMAAVDAMKTGDVLVVDADHNRQCAFWGELLSTACLAKGVKGVVMSACTRDLWALEKFEFPVFGIGHTPVDSKGRIDVTHIGEPIYIDGVEAKNGDYILGDADGAVIIPANALGETLQLAQEKVNSENTLREDLSGGMPVAEAFKKHGIL